jgi:protein TonB
MKKNNMFFVVLGLSAALHGLALFGAGGKGLRAPPPVLETRTVSMVRIVRTRTAPQKSIPHKPHKPVEEKKVVEKSVEPAQEPVQETEYQETEYIEDSIEGNIETNEPAQHGAEETEDSGRITSDDYEALLAYIKEYIDKNLIYPPMAKRRNIQGVAGVSFEIEKNGELVSITVNHSSGSSILDNAALSLIKKIHPVRNIPVKSKLALNVNIEYKLTE